VRAARQVEAALRGDDDLPVDRSRHPELKQRFDELGKEPGERPLVAAAQVDAARPAEGEAAEAVPLGLVEVAVARQLPLQAGEHRLERRVDGEPPRPRRRSFALHATFLPVCSDPKSSP
jgi:hypothetical protein